MQLETARFGTIDIDAEAIVTFTQPIVGFQDYRRFVLLPGPSEFLRWLQSTDSGDLAFILMDPTTVIPDYRVDIASHDLSELAANALEDLEVYTLVVVPQDRTKVRTNLKAPILINPKQRLGKQVILERSDYPVQFFLAQGREGQPSEAGPGDKEVSNARSNA